MRTPVKKAPAKVKKPATGSVALRQRALELAVQSSSVVVHRDYVNNGIGGYMAAPVVTTTRQYEADAAILKTAKAFLDFMQGN